MFRWTMMEFPFSIKQLCALAIAGIMSLSSAGLCATLGYGTVRVDAQNKLLPRTTPDECDRRSEPPIIQPV